MKTNRKLTLLTVLLLPFISFASEIKLENETWDQTEIEYLQIKAEMNELPDFEDLIVTKHSSLEELNQLEKSDISFKRKSFYSMFEDNKNKDLLLGVAIGVGSCCLGYGFLVLIGVLTT